MAKVLRKNNEPKVKLHAKDRENNTNYSSPFFEISFTQAEKILMHKNNSDKLITLADDKFELTKDGLKHRKVTKSTKKSEE